MIDTTCMSICVSYIMDVIACLHGDNVDLR